MRKPEVPREEWSEFLELFQQLHHGHLCSLAVSTTESRLKLHPLILASLGRDADAGRIRVLLSDWSGNQVAHVIIGPRHLYFDRPADTTQETLEIDGAGGTTTMTFEASS